MTFKFKSNSLKLARMVGVGLSFAAAALSAASQVVPGVLLRKGNWNQDVGSYGIPQAWEHLPVRSWPMDAWATFDIDSTAATLAVQPLSSAEARRQLEPILQQLEAVASDAIAAPPEPASAPSEVLAPARLPAYIRVPGLVWQPRIVPLYRFKNGTPRLTPALDHRFELEMNGRRFAFMFQNGFRTKDGRPYGEGTQFHLEIDGQHFDYDLGGYGWDVRIQAVGDFDGDGRPDFIFVVGGANSSHEALILSTQARPGRNPPTAYLSSWGC